MEPMEKLELEMQLIAEAEQVLQSMVQYELELSRLLEDSDYDPETIEKQLSEEFQKTVNKLFFDLGL